MANPPKKRFSDLLMSGALDPMKITRIPVREEFSVFPSSLPDRPSPVRYIEVGKRAGKSWSRELSEQLREEEDARFVEREAYERLKRLRYCEVYGTPLRAEVSLDRHPMTATEIVLRAEEALRRCDTLGFADPCFSSLKWSADVWDDMSPAEHVKYQQKWDAGYKPISARSRRQRFALRLSRKIFAPIPVVCA